MNYSPQILAHLAQQQFPCPLVMAPGAPPVVRTDKDVQIALNVVLDATAVADTLEALRKRTARMEPCGADESGTFSFGIRDVGRIRVSFATQRGSHVVVVTRIPHEVEPVASLCADKAVAEKLSSVLAVQRPGLLAVAGSSVVRNSALVYALLKEVNEGSRRIVYIFERRLTFLMAHADSLVIQTELDEDAKSMQDGVRRAFDFDPHVLFVGDVRATDEISSVRDAVSSGMLTIISSVSLDADALLERYTPPVEASAKVGAGFFRGAVCVNPTEGSGVEIDYKEVTIA